MKKLFFLFAGALLAFSANAKSPVARQAAFTDPTVIVRAGFCPEYYEGYLCGIFVTIEKRADDSKIVGLADPQPHVFQIRSDNDWVEVTDKVLISYDVRYESQDEGVLHCSFTYRYPGGEVQTYSIDLEYYPGGEPV